MTEDNLHDKQEQKYLETLSHFGVNTSDCTFSMLKHYAGQLSADKPDTLVKRWHDPIIQKLVEPGNSIIDLGCGDGELLARIGYTKHCLLQGVERDENNVYRCIERGIPVCHADVSDFLDLIPDKSYTWSILEDTLQTLDHPLEILEKMLRISSYSIVSFPNFAHWSVRFTFSLGGRMPVTKSLPNKWFNTPNIHLCSINDFMDWVDEAGVKILHSWVLTEGNVEQYDKAKKHNITAEQALFVIEKKG